MPGAEPGVAYNSEENEHFRIYWVCMTADLR